jgi:hypothetical protein
VSRWRQPAQASGLTHQQNTSSEFAGLSLAPIANEYWERLQVKNTTLERQRIYRKDFDEKNKVFEQDELAA